MRAALRARQTVPGDSPNAANPKGRQNPAPARSWWTQYAQPDQRTDFIDAARERNVARQRAEDSREGLKNQLMRHIIDPRQHPPKLGRGWKAHG